MNNTKLIHLLKTFSQLEFNEFGDARYAREHQHGRQIFKKDKGLAADGIVSFITKSLIEDEYKKTEK